MEIPDMITTTAAGVGLAGASLTVLAATGKMAARNRLHRQLGVWKTEIDNATDDSDKAHFIALHRQTMARYLAYTAVPPYFMVTAGTVLTACIAWFLYLPLPAWLVVQADLPVAAFVGMLVYSALFTGLLGYFARASIAVLRAGRDERTRIMTEFVDKELYPRFFAAPASWQQGPIHVLRRLATTPPGPTKRLAEPLVGKWWILIVWFGICTMVPVSNLASYPAWQLSGVLWMAASVLALTLGMALFVVLFRRNGLATIQRGWGTA